MATALAIYAAWARGGTPDALQIPLPILGALLLILLWVEPIRPWNPPHRRPARDPVTWAGLLFLLLLTVQWWNAGRFHYFDPFREAWGYTPARVSSLTAAMTRGEAAEMLRWFFPAWALLIFLRCGISDSREARWIVGVLAINGAVLAIFGIVQQWSGTESIFWITDLEKTRFFASFGYENHAGAYFVLMSAISLGLLAGEVLRSDRPPRVAALVVWGLAGILNFVGANLSFSRAGILLSWVLVAGALVYLLRQGYRRWRAGTWINVGLAALLITVVAAMTAEQFGGKTITRELASLRETIDPRASRAPHSTLVLGARIALLKAAGNIWLDYPWFGCGGWGYRYLLPYELPDDDWQWSSTAYGKANVHNDPAQFLAEFGAVGAGLMAVCVIGLAGPALRSRHKRPLTVLILAGTGLVVVHSLVDLPFRCPAILYAWLIALGCAAVLETGFPPRRCQSSVIGHQ